MSGHRWRAAGNGCPERVFSEYGSRKTIRPTDHRSSPASFGVSSDFQLYGCVHVENYPSEMNEKQVDNVYLNATCIPREKLAERFPNISKKCLEHGIDISKDFIPVAPAAHYFMGGVKTNID